MSGTIEHQSPAASAVLGGSLLLIGTLLHPSSADPNQAAAAFAEYAADTWWVTSHLLQLGGAAFLIVALVLLARQFKAGRGAGIARAANLLAGVSLALAAALQAVDGVALKVMVDTWANAPRHKKRFSFTARSLCAKLKSG